MITTQEERLEIYTHLIPRLNWFDRKERIELVKQAEENAKQNGDVFWTTLENLTFMKSFEIPSRKRR